MKLMVICAMGLLLRAPPVRADGAAEMAQTFETLRVHFPETVPAPPEKSKVSGIASRVIRHGAAVEGITGEYTYVSQIDKAADQLKISGLVEALVVLSYAGDADTRLRMVALQVMRREGYLRVTDSELGDIQRGLSQEALQFEKGRKEKGAATASLAKKFAEAVVTRHGASAGPK